VSKLKGRTVTYIPILEASPSFTPTIAALKAATAKAGLRLNVCDGGANPSAVAACLAQAVSGHSAAVITDAIPEDFAASAFAALQKAGIPLVYSDYSVLPVTKLQATTGGAEGVLLAKLQAEWVVDDSGADANVIIVESTDDQEAIDAVTQGASKVFATSCPNCKVDIVKTLTANMEQLPSLISSELVRDPGAQYIVSEFDDYVPSVVSALQTSGKTGVKVVGADSELQEIQSVAAANSVVADVGYSAYQTGWQDLDQALRLATGTPALSDEEPAFKIFDAANAAGLPLTAAANTSNAWFGGSDFEQAYLQAWGVG
jgi:ribose transport system substrate-binding protein